MGGKRRHLETAGVAGNRQTLGVARWRVALGIALIAGLLFFVVMLSGPYLRNWRLQQQVERIAFDPAMQALPDPSLAGEIAHYGTQLGIPVRPEQVRITRSAVGVYLEVRYFVRVDLGVYTVDLHFRPSAGAR